MKLKYYQASRENGQQTQHAECLEIGRLTICMETTDNRLHLLYQQDIPALLNEAGYGIAVKEIDIPSLDENFNELSFCVYEGIDCNAYLFDGLAVKANVNGHIEYHAQDELTVEALNCIWGNSGIDFEEPFIEIHIPGNQAGELAIRMEQFQFDVWDLLDHAPGEDVSAEVRLETIQAYYDEIKGGKSPVPDIDDSKELLSDSIQEWKAEQSDESSEEQENTNRDIDQAENLLQQAEHIKQEYNALAQGLPEIRRAENESLSML